MQLKDAIALIEDERFQTDRIQAWADLGCGSGLFTSALASRLPYGSTIHAVDNDRDALKKIRDTEGILIRRIECDFVSDQLDFSGLNGILMANSIHYVKDKMSLINKIARFLQPDGCFLFIEYDTDLPVPVWVPYPASFQSLTILLEAAGFRSAVKLGQRRSAYNRGMLYSAVFKR